ncbi:short-subunit dehydrogenase [Breoghania corrubedonensis]|uniref:Short-subunit dehydrogenase n=1 Tax=Breoghania corrubedonensis TaxID=665038 RepID=A0A2T5US84_9HYPH|nr:SDR family NAD(P)-dependent oxidoreductase [Breoghania corrubedonensis]PTW54353.1 short-subunit dehydrogenase [Breoghania corrubedonensis]
MEVSGRIVVVTGGAGGIGHALAHAAAEAGASHVVVADIDGEGARRTASEVGGTGWRVDVAREDEISALIARTEDEIGPIGLFCGNAGIILRGGFEIANADWERIWKINVMAHVWTARHLVPRMAARGEGHVLITASAAGLLSQVGSAPYAVTKHGAVAVAEWMALTHGDDGIRVSLLCPQAVRTDMTAGREDSVASVDGMMTAEEVAAAGIRAVEEGRFLVLPHPQVRDYMRRRADDTDRWIGGMRKLNRTYNTPADA